MADVLAKLRPGVTVTASARRSGLGRGDDQLSESRVEMALAHAIPNAVEAAYRRGDLFEKRRRLMEDWAHYCGAPVQRDDAMLMRAPVA